MEAAARRTAGWGLWCRRSLWVPTWRGWSLLGAITVLLLAMLFFGAYPFLAEHEPLSTGILVVEGWVAKTAYPTAVAVARQGHYSSVFATGGPLDEDSDLIGFRTYAEVGATRLREHGLTDAIAVPSEWVRKDRTYTSALDLRNWLRAHGGVPSQITLFTHGVHARRSCLLFQKAFRGEARIGVYSLPPREYDPARWYTSSAGVREVIGEGIAYLYARLFFWPSAPAA